MTVDYKGTQWARDVASYDLDLGTLLSLVVAAMARRELTLDGYLMDCPFEYSRDFPNASAPMPAGSGFEKVAAAARLVRGMGLLVGKTFTSQQGGTLSEAGLDLMKGMLCLSPDRRITAKEAMRHRYFDEHPPPKPHHLFPTMPSTHAGGKPKPKVKSVNEEEEQRRLNFHER